MLMHIRPCVRMQLLCGRTSSLHLELAITSKQGGYDLWVICNFSSLFYPRAPAASKKVTARLLLSRHSRVSIFRRYVFVGVNTLQRYDNTPSTRTRMSGFLVLRWYNDTFVCSFLFYSYVVKETPTGWGCIPSIACGSRAAPLGY